MKFLVTVLLCQLFAINSFSQAQYEFLKDEQHPQQHILRGIINKYIVQNDTTYNWYKSSASNYKADTAVLSAFEKAKNKVQFVIFGGTWCEDTQFILPKFFKLQEMSGVTDTAITFFWC